MINLGNRVKHLYNGFEGVAIRRIEYLYGCAQISVDATKLSKDGTPIDIQVFDEQALETTEKAKKTFKVPKAVFSLGSHVRDTLTGFEGVVTGRQVSLFEPPRVSISPQQLQESKPATSYLFEEARVELVKKDKPRVSQEHSARSGGPQVYPKCVR